DAGSSMHDLIQSHRQSQRYINHLLKIELLEINKFDSTFISNVNAIFDQQYDANIEKSCISGLIETNQFPHILGQEQETKNYVYALLKLNWMRLNHIDNQP